MLSAYKYANINCPSDIWCAFNLARTYAIYAINIFCLNSNFRIVFGQPTEGQSNMLPIYEICLLKLLPKIDWKISLHKRSCLGFL